MTLSGVDVRVLCHELKQQIVGSWITNIYHLPSNIFIIKLRKPQIGLQYLLIEPGKRIHLSQFNRIMPSEPSNFCKTLRSHLRDRRINAVDQRDLDRIVTLNIGPDDGFKLVVELFGKGNMIFVSQSDKIINALSYRKMRDRDIHPGRPYIHMPSIDRDIIRNGTKGFEEILKNQPKLVPAMNYWLGLGPYYSKYILNKLDISTKKSNDLSNDELNRIIQKAEELHKLLLDHNYNPVVYLDGEIIENNSEKLEDDDVIESSYDDQWSELPFNPEDVIKILPWEQRDEDKYFLDSFGTGLDIYYSSQEEEEDISGETEELTSTTERLNNQLNLQLLHQENLREEASQYRGDADALYEHFQTASELISTVYEARKKNMAWEEIENRLLTGKGKGIESALLFNSLIIKEGLMKLDLPANGEKRIVKIDFRKSLTENANGYYQKAKKSEKKAKNADIAIEMTRSKIKNTEESTNLLQKKVIEQETVLKRRKSWFEKWHWTFSDSGMLIIAGLDASTNERLVKTYLDDDDFFLHADIQGAAATIIKTNGREINDATLRTAAIISVSYSAAWKLQRPTADAYAVGREQVSLSAPSGQFLPKGGFMIYGTKNYIKDVPLKLYIGLIVEKHWAKLILSVSPEITNALSIVEIIPGDTQRGKIAKMLKKGFINEVEEKDINKVKTIDIGDFALLLPGPSQVSRWIKGTSNR